MVSRQTAVTAVIKPNPYILPKTEHKDNLHGGKNCVFSTAILYQQKKVQLKLIIFLTDDSPDKYVKCQVKINYPRVIGSNLL